MSVKDSQSSNDFIKKISTIQISRRELLKMAAIGAAGSVIAGCAPKATATATPAESVEAVQQAVETGKPVLNIAQWGGDWLEYLKTHIIADFEKDYDCVVNVDTSYPFWPKMAAAPLEEPPLDLINDNLPHSFRMQDAGMLFSPDEIKKKLKHPENFWDFAFEGTGGDSCMESVWNCISK